MEKLGANEIRSRFLKFFEGKGHLVVPAASLIPENDRSLLIINSGMAPLKPYFTGQETPKSKRLASCQKCVRTGDIENVGVTSRHATFFEMLGNFSFGDYFKKEAIGWAWEFLINDLGFDKDRLYVTVYLEDDEAYDIWSNEIGIPKEKIYRLDKGENFWELGLGPCGPCSEIYYDRGQKYGCGAPDCSVECECDRFVEIWNLVFTQFNKCEDGSYSNLEHPNIDTGMGLERLAVMIQGVPSIFDIDTFVAVRDKVCELAGYKYNDDAKKDISVRIITDHIRSVTFMTCDGILPSNEKRGYVLRRLLRRASRHGKLLGIDDMFLSELSKTVISVYEDAYPALSEKKDYIHKLLSVEEKRFYDTLDQGIEILKQFIANMKEKMLDRMYGEDAFKLYDTYGFPLELMQEILLEEGLSLDETAFEVEMQRQRERARSSRETTNYMGANETVYDKIDVSVKTEFVGYTMLSISGAVVTSLITENQIVNEAVAPSQVSLVLDRTPFYAEGGGQVGDSGVIKTETGTVEIYNCIKVHGNKYLHIGEVTEGFVKLGQTAEASVDEKRRGKIMRNHSAAHLLQKALKRVLGAHIEQAGSMVNDKVFRFDFTHFAPMTKEEIRQVEDVVYENIMAGLPVSVSELPIDDARKKGAIALFGEKYGDIVRVVEMGYFSAELCGGTHVHNTAQVGMFKILSEHGVSAGVRRIEGLTGENALNYYRETENALDTIAAFTKSNQGDLIKKIEQNFTQVKELTRELSQLKSKLSGNAVDDILAQKEDINGIKVVCANINDMDINGLRTMGDTLKDKLVSGVVILAGGKDDKYSILVMATNDVLEKGINAGNIVKAAAAVAGGSGGGKANMAQAGVKDPSKITEALQKAKELIG